MADKNAEVAVEDNGGMKKTLSLWNFFTIGFGAIIGTGWVLQVGDWMVVGGGPVPAMIAFLLGAIFLVPVGAVFGELTAAIPISGGIVEYVDRSFGRTLSYITGWLLALGNGILCPWEAIAISTLVSEMFGSLPGLEWLRAVKLYTILGADVYLFPTLIALGFAAYVIFLNFRGASSAAKLQAFLTKALLCGMLLAMGVSLFTGSPDNAMPVFSQVTGAGGGKAATEGTSLFAGIVSVLVLTPFFYAGFDTIPQQAEEAAEGLNWNKFGKIISLALLAATDFYDVLAHLIYPLRYMQAPVTLNRYQDAIRAILRTAVEKGRGMEVNTCRGRTLEEWRPILALYRDCGGELVTVGSDAHTPADVGKGVRAACALLRECGFRRVCTYEKHQPVFHTLG